MLNTGMSEGRWLTWSFVPRLMTMPAGTQELKSHRLSAVVPWGSDELLDGTVANVRCQMSEASVLPPQQFSAMPKPLQATVWHCAPVMRQIWCAHEA